MGTETFPGTSMTDLLSRFCFLRVLWHREKGLDLPWEFCIPEQELGSLLTGGAWCPPGSGGLKGRNSKEGPSSFLTSGLGSFGVGEGVRQRHCVWKNLWKSLTCGWDPSLWKSSLLGLNHQCQGT